jgi:hypothetical protein
MNGENDRLSPLWESYRNACPAPDASAGFMPGLWEKIDARRSFVWKLRLYTRGLVTAAAALCLVMAGLTIAPIAGSGDVIYTHTYIDTLSDSQGPETIAYAEFLQQDEDGFLRRQ